MRNASGKTLTYELATVEVEINQKKYRIEAAVARQLPADVLPGKDVPILENVIRRVPKDEKQKLVSLLTTEAVTTRAQGRKFRDEEQQQREERRVGGKPSPVKENESAEAKEVEEVDFNFVDELFDDFK